MNRNCVTILFCFLFFISSTLTLGQQVKWVNVDSLYAPLPPSVQVFITTDSLEGKPFIAYYVKARLKDKGLHFTVDTTLGRRLTPTRFYEKNNNPLVLVNCTFFNFDKSQNLNTVIKEGKLVGYNNHSLPMRGKDTLQYRHPLASAFGIDKRRNADIAWTLTDSSKKFAYASQIPPGRVLKDSVRLPAFSVLKSYDFRFITGNVTQLKYSKLNFKKWKMKTAVGGGPVIVQDGRVSISNETELKFAGKAINDKHPRTCLGYTSDGYLIIMAIQGRFPGRAEGATLEQEAKLLIELGCTEALNLDGGGSSCLLINGKETIKPSDKEGQRPVPAVFIISRK
jgi:hypothetical protein